MGWGRIVCSLNRLGRSLTHTQCALVVMIARTCLSVRGSSPDRVTQTVLITILVILAIVALVLFIVRR